MPIEGLIFGHQTYFPKKTIQRNGSKIMDVSFRHDIWRSGLSRYQFPIPGAHEDDSARFRQRRQILEKLRWTWHVLYNFYRRHHVIDLRGWKLDRWHATLPAKSQCDRRKITANRSSPNGTERLDQPPGSTSNIEAVFSGQSATSVIE